MMRFTIGPGVKWPGLNKAVEECGELLSALGKVMSFPNEPYPDGSDVVGNLNEELADVMAAVWFVIYNNVDVDEFFVADRAKAKLARFDHWQGGGTEVLDVPSWVSA